MTTAHNIPMLEDDLHELSEHCPCGPVIDVNEETGQITWVHLPLRNDHILDEFIQI